MRWLLALTLLNTVLLGSYILGPGIGPYLQQQFNGWQAARAAKRQAAAAAAKRPAAMQIETPALAFSRPPKTLVFDDTIGATTKPARTPKFPAVIPNPREFLVLPTVLKGWGLLQNTKYVLLFMHERQAQGSSPARLVIVFLDPQPPHYENNALTHDPFRRSFLVITAQPTTPQDDLRGLAYTSYEYIEPANAPGLRIFAGQVDPNDSANFTIAYELGGVPGTIKGSLNSDDRVDFIPEGPLQWSSTTSSLLSP